MSLKKYQEGIIQEVRLLVEQNKKRISVLMPAGAGITRIACVIANEVLKNTIVIVHRTEICDYYNNMQNSMYTETSTLVVPVNKFIAKQESSFETQIELSGKSYVLLSTTPRERILLKEIIPKDSIVVNIGGLEPFKNHDDEIVNIENILGQVFYTDELLDVRDIITANANDSKSLFRQIQIKKSENSDFIETQNSIRKIGSINKEKELYERIKNLEQQNQLLKMLICSAGISLDVINEYLQNTSEKKESLSHLINRDDENAIESFFNYIAEYSQKLFKPSITEFNKQYFSSLIESCLSKTVWDKMTDESRTCIITSKVAYESLQKADTDGIMDYSGVCILAAKALDIEITKRFVYQYIEYLQANKQRKEWPKTILDEDDELLSDEKFTLGKVKYIVGIDENGSIRNKYVYRMFCEFANKHLYSKSFDKFELRNNLTNCIQCVEKVRNDYRNPAAHRTSLSSITAKECIDYLVDTYKKLKEILINMK